MRDNAKVTALPVENDVNDAFTPYPDPPQNLIITAEIEDLWVGPCDSCGYAVFSGDDFQVENNKPVCAACVVERCSWFKLSPVVRKVA
jgi:hypothetical protein